MLLAGGLKIGPQHPWEQAMHGLLMAPNTSAALGVITGACWLPATGLGGTMPQRNKADSDKGGCLMTFMCTGTQTQKLKEIKVMAVHV